MFPATECLPGRLEMSTDTVCGTIYKMKEFIVCVLLPMTGQENSLVTRDTHWRYRFIQSTVITQLVQIS